MDLPKDLFSMIWYFARAKSIWLLGIIVITFVFAMLTSFVSYALKEVIDSLVIAKKESFWADMFSPCMFFICCYLGISVSLRLRNFFSLVFYPSLHRSMMVYLHELLQKRPYQYYQEQLNLLKMCLYL